MNRAIKSHECKFIDVLTMMTRRSVDDIRERERERERERDRTQGRPRMLSNTELYVTRQECHEHR